MAGQRLDQAEALAAEARKSFADTAGQAGQSAPGTLAASMRTQAEAEAVRILLTQAYRRQDWFTAASLLDAGGTQTLDKTLVATVLRKSGRTSEAIEFASRWHASDPDSEPAAEAFLRSLAATTVASAGRPGTSDSSQGLLALVAASSSVGIPAGQDELVGLVFSLLSTSSSAGMRSYLYYLKGSLISDPNAAIDNYRAALLARADNVEALVALARAYAAKADGPKALFYIKQARMIGVSDKELEAELATLEKSLSGR